MKEPSDLGVHMPKGKAMKKVKAKKAKLKTPMHKGGSTKY
jgi:hypothetical protein